MDKLRALTEYIQTYRARTTQLDDYRIAREWMDAGIAATIAASWARAGYLPAEALPRIAAGLTPGQASDQDATLIAERGIIGYAAAMLQLETPGATLIVDPDVETAIEEIEGQR
jgi:hypothetical protein